ncbi:hypothetical protein PUN28_001066 [Cardiocondyla obscurior]|uniref:Uncharacterized protein n=1 Tax=Cardiocondyla obscurior TaxID=286306 RepID=A0AAW2H2Z7_9HYME
MVEGGQAERSTRGGLRGPRGPRGEKLEKGRFKYQPPRGGPRACCLYLASFFFSRADTPRARILSFSAPPRCHPLTTLRRSSLMHTHRETQNVPGARARSVAIVINHSVFIRIIERTPKIQLLGKYRNKFLLKTKRRNGQTIEPLD